MHEQARAHYDMGTGAYVRADYKTAAQEFALADKMSPSSVALSAALDAAIQAELGPLAMELVQRSARGGVDAPLASLVGKARARFGKRVGKVRVACGAGCTAKLDNAPIELEKDQFAWVGRHTVTVERQGGARERPVDVTAEGRVDVVVSGDPGATPTPTPTPTPGPTPGPTPTPTPTPSDSGLSPSVFFTGVGLTTALGAVTIFSAVDTSHKHSDYFSLGCDKVLVAGCVSTSTDGIAAQHRTNVLLGVTAGIAAATTVVGIFFTRWRSSVSAQVVGSAATAQLRVAWP
jgi:hypothetical protein